MRLFLVGALVLGAVGCTSPRVAAPEASRPDLAALEATHRARVEARRARFTPAEVAFIGGMIHHHAQALQMSAYARANGAGAEVARLAARIDNAQRDEITTMQRWLADRGQPAPELHEMDGTVMVHGGGHDMHAGHGGHAMPGMLTDAQLAELRDARGRAFDRLFLTYMIQHHAGAVTMVDDLFASDGAAQDPDTYRLASDIQVDQRTEIARMQRMLDALPSGR